MIRITLLLAAGVLIAVACGRGDDETASRSAAMRSETAEAVAAQGSTPTDGRQEPAADAADASGDLVFDERVLQGEIAPGVPDPDVQITVAIPVGWETSNPNFPDIFTPPASAGFDPLLTAMSVGGSCAGGCGPQPASEWARRAEAMEFAQFRNQAAFEILREQELADGRLVLAVNNFGVVAMTVARWKGGAEQYFYCRFSADEDDLELVPSFGAACAQATATFLGR